MSTPTWLRNLFAARPPRALRKARALRQLPLESREDRTALSSCTAATATGRITARGLANAAGGTNTITLTWR